MPQVARKGEYYEFNRERPKTELGKTVPYSHAISLIRGGRDVYTASKEDAYKLAKSVYSTPPEECFTGDLDHFRHYHPGGVHPQYKRADPAGFGKAREGFGHVFFALRGGK